MMPSAGSRGTDGGSGRSSPLRRWGPAAAIAVVVAVVVAFVVVGGGDKGNSGSGNGVDAAATTTAPAATGSTDASGGVVDTTPPAAGAISFRQAQEQHLDVTFEDSCDQTTGRIAMPYYFAPECFANVDDNGGATAPGVTGDTIKVVVYVAPEQDTILDYITSAIHSDDTRAQAEATILGYGDMLNDLYQTYGRRVQLEFLEGSGQSTDEVAARADAVRAATEMGAFAVLGSPALTNAWTDEIAARGIACIGCFGLPDPNPEVFTVLPSSGENRLILTEYILKKLAGKPATFAGDPAFQTRTRTLGNLYIETGPSDAQHAAELEAGLEAGGSGFAAQLSYALDPNRLQEEATPIISQFKDAGVTTVVVQSDPIAMATFTREATAQDYFPEWVIGPSTLIDTAAFGRTYDQRQWAHAFGISPLAARTDRDSFPSLYQWYYGQEAPANDTEGVLSPNLLILFAALQNAGPGLTEATLRQGLDAIDPIPGSITAPSFSFGDHGLFPGLDEADQAGIDDWTEIWWNADATGPDELDRDGQGMYEYVDGGKRYFVGDLTSDLHVFDPAGAVTIYTSLPPAEAGRVTEYPSPHHTPPTVGG